MEQGFAGFVIFVAAATSALIIIGGFHMSNQRDSERIACTQAMAAKHPERSTADILQLCGVKQ